jgi:hypothetical protein
LESIQEFLSLDEEMNWTKTENSMAYSFERAGGIDSLEEVQKHPNYELYKMANDILTKFFDQDDKMDAPKTESEAAPQGRGPQPYSGGAGNPI